MYFYQQVLQELIGDISKVLFTDKILISEMGAVRA